MIESLDDAHSDSGKRWDFAYKFLEEFTFEEIGKISISTDITIGAMRLMLSMWTDYLLAVDPRISIGMSRLVDVGIISQSRHDEIMGIISPIEN